MRDALVCAKVSGRLIARRFTTPLGLHTYICSVDGPGVDLYIHVNPTEPKCVSKARSEDVIFWSAVLIDIDPSGKKSKNTNGAMWEVLKTLNEWGYAGSTLITDSGRGRQMWLMLNPLISFANKSTPTRQQAEAAAAHFLRKLNDTADIEKFGCVIDPCTSDLSRLARLPWTTNSKTNMRGYVIAYPISRVLTDDFYERWRVPDMAPAEPMVEPKDGWSIKKVLAHITGKAATFLTSGWASPGRRGAIYAAAASLAEAGVPEMVAWDWVQRANKWCKPEPLGPSALQSPFDNGWKRGVEKRATA